MVATLTFERDELAESAISAVISFGRHASAKGWVPATSGNFSVRIDGERIAITRSGVDKGSLTRDDILVQDLDEPLQAGSSAEAALHVSRYNMEPRCNAILHIHGLYSTVIAQAHATDEALSLHGWELQKALAGVRTHDVTVDVPVFANAQDIGALAEQVDDVFRQPITAGHHRAPGYLIAGHGLYAWGNSVDEALRHVEALETLFKQVVTLRSYQS